MLQRQQADRQFGRIGARAQVSNVTLGCEHGNLSVILSENQSDASGFPGVAVHGGRAVGVHVADGIETDAGVGNGGADRAGQTAAVAATVEGGAEADDFGINACATPAGVFQVFEHENARAFSQDHAVAQAIKRPRRLLRGVVAMRQLLKKRLPNHAERVDATLAATDQEKVGLVANQDAVCPTKRQQARDAALRDRAARSLSVVQNRNVAGEHVWQVFQHPQGCNVFDSRCPIFRDRRSPSWPLALTWAATPSSSNSLAIKLAPNSTPKRKVQFLRPRRRRREPAAQRHSELYAAP